MPAPFDPALPLYFQHIPKTAGTSITMLLKRAIPADELCPTIHWDDIVEIQHSTVRKYRYFIGHFGQPLGRFLGADLNRFAVLRDPVQRTISHYAHIQRASHHPFHEAAKGKSLLEFVLDPVTRHNVENYQARYIADLGTDVRLISNSFAAPNDRLTPLQMHVDELSRHVEEGLLRERAIAALDTFFAIGVTDYVDELMKTVGRAVGIQLEQLPHANTDPNAELRQEPDAETIEAIAAATRVDRELYEIVRANVDASAS